MTSPSSSGFALPPSLRPRASSSVLSLPQEENLGFAAILEEKSSDPTYSTLISLLQGKLKTPCSLNDFYKYLRVLDKARTLHLTHPTIHTPPAFHQDDSGHAECEVETSSFPPLPSPPLSPPGNQLGGGYGDLIDFLTWYRTYRSSYLRLPEPLRKPSFSSGFFNTPPLSPCSDVSPPESPDFHISVFDEEEFLSMEEAAEEPKWDSPHLDPYPHLPPSPSSYSSLPILPTPALPRDPPSPHSTSSPHSKELTGIGKTSMGKAAHRPPPILLISQSPPSTPSFSTSPVTPRSPFSPTLPYQDEMDGAVNKYISSSHLLPYTVKEIIIHSLAHSTHPDILMPAIDAALDLLVLPAQTFTQDAIQNISPPTAYFRLLVSFLGLVLGLVLVGSFMAAEYARWWRLIPLPWMSIAIPYILSHVHGIDPMRAFLGLTEPQTSITYRSRLLSGWKETYGGFWSALRGCPYIFLGKPLTPSILPSKCLVVVEEYSILQIQRSKAIFYLSLSTAIVCGLWLVILLIPSSF
ncbi:MAG: hypothetical protein DHS80DRAFT_21895 [Piptocephalis tieghemiana]|nr:MAG: hypothetical protein DHS80DRAFT_21895 [Piptocephalis tieghemiana]